MNNKTKYPWDFAPDWAEFAATDRNGEAWWFSDKPVFYDHDGAWIIESNTEYSASTLLSTNSPHAADWQNSLEKRPDHE